MKTFQLAIDERQAHAIGFALKRALRELENKSDAHARDLTKRLGEVYLKIDTCPEIPALNIETNAYNQGLRDAAAIANGLRKDLYGGCSEAILGAIIPTGQTLKCLKCGAFGHSAFACNKY